MAISQLRNSDLLAYDDHQFPSLTPSIPQYRTNAAAENRVSGLNRVERRAAAPDPFTFYKTYFDTNESLLGDQEDLKSDDNDYACHSGAAAHDALVDDAQPQGRCHTAAYKLAVRLANRSNGAPLATIIEQGSYSTLNSHGSLLSVGRFPSLKAAENTSPNRVSKRRSRSLDGKALHDIQEDLIREHDTFTVAVPHARLDEEHGAADQASGTATPLTSYRFELQQSPSSQPDDDSFVYDNRGVKGFIRGVFHTVRGVSRTRSRSSSVAHVPIMEHRESPPSTGGSSLQLNQEGQDSGFNHLQDDSRSILTCASQVAAIVPASRDQTRNHAISSLGVEHSACAYPPLYHSRSTLTDSTTVFGCIPPVLPYRAATSSHGQPFSTPAARPGTRDMAREDGTTQAATFHYDMSDTSVRHAVNGVHVCCKYPSSLKEVSSAREVFTNQNASFCSTMSTSYSGTVLGVDLDLRHDFNNPARRSESPPTPVWFTPQMAELERQASFSESPESVKAYIAAHAPCRSITSSALTALLPIAAASGIVRPIYSTPGICFYSPSGNLIRPESSSHRDTSTSEYGGSPKITTSYYNKQKTSAGGLPVRPTLIPMTTPPILKTPLPPHLQHHHNYLHPEKSQIHSYESVFTPKGPVKGCDGVVRENSLTPRSGIFYPHGRDRIHRSIKLTMHDLKAEAKFYKARFTALAAAQSFAPSLPKSKNWRKRQVQNYNTYARKPHTNSFGTAGPRKGGHREGNLGPLAAHALRVCFCQPYDGAGKPTHATATRACVSGKPIPKSVKLNTDQHAKDTEQSLPNARIVGSGGHSQSGNAKRATRRDSAIGSTAREASKAGMARKKVD